MNSEELFARQITSTHRQTKKHRERERAFECIPKMSWTGVIVTNCDPLYKVQNIKLNLSSPKRLIRLLLCTLFKCECHGSENTKQTNWANAYLVPINIACWPWNECQTNKQKPPNEKCFNNIVFVISLKWKSVGMVTLEATLMPPRLQINNKRI